MTLNFHVAVLSFPVTMFVCVCVHLLWYGSNPDSSLYAGGAAIFNICGSLSQPCESICERTASQKASTWLAFLSFPIWSPYPQRRAFSSSSSGDIDTHKSEKMEARGKEAMSDLFELNSYVSAHDVNNVLLWYDPSPLTLTPSCLTSTGLSTQWSDPRSNQSDSVRTKVHHSQLL